MKTRAESVRMSNEKGVSYQIKALRGNRVRVTFEFPGDFHHGAGFAEMVVHRFVRPASDEPKQQGAA